MSEHTWTYWTDYDAIELNDVPEQQQQQIWADWLEERVRRTVIAPLRKIKNEHIQPAGQENSSALLIFSVSICCAIEAMGKYLAPTSRNNERFKCFVKKYMDTGYDTQLNGKSYAEYLWKDFRNGLAHGFAIARGKFEQRGDEEYFVESTDGMGHPVLSLNWDKLFDDFEKGCKRYFGDVRAADCNSSIVKDFKKAFREVCIDRL